MGFTDKHLYSRAGGEWDETIPWHILSWIAAAILQFVLFYVPLRVLGWWAFGFPPWLIVVAAMAPVMTIMPDSDPITALIIAAAIWVAGAVALLLAGLWQRKIVLVSTAVHMVMTPAMMACAFWMAVQANGGNLAGTS